MGKNNISEYGGNAEKLYFTGDSAGGNLALDISYKISGGIYTVSSNGTTLPDIDAVSVVYPVANPITFYDNDNLMTKTSSAKMASSYTGGSPEEYPDRYAAIIPGNYITVNTPPTAILVGTADALVPPEATYELADQLESKNIDNQLVKLPYGNHVFDGVAGNLGNQAFINLTLKWFSQY